MAGILGRRHSHQSMFMQWGELLSSGKEAWTKWNTVTSQKLRFTQEWQKEIVLQSWDTPWNGAKDSLPAINSADQWEKMKGIRLRAVTFCAIQAAPPWCKRVGMRKKRTWCFAQVRNKLQHWILPPNMTSWWFQPISLRIGLKIKMCWNLKPPPKDDQVTHHPTTWTTATPLDGPFAP